MKNFLIALLGGVFMSACSVFGHSGVENAAYKTLVQKENIEVRQYINLIMVTTSMGGSMESDRNGSFNKLFRYISGDNVRTEEIAMTAPVIMDQKPQGEKIAMTAPVIMDQTNNDGEKWTMSFVLPASYTYENAPRPTHPDVKLEQIEDMTAVVIRFNGFLSDDNVQDHLKKLQDWLAKSKYQQIGPYKVAGYDPPFTLPMARRNEVLIPVVKK